MFQKILIIKHSGECIYFLDLVSGNKSGSNKLDPQLFSGFLSAIMSFYDQLGNNIVPGEESFDQFAIKNNKYYILDTGTMYFCITDDGINSSVSNDDVLDILHNVKKTFYDFTNAGKFNLDSSVIFINKEFENEIRDIISEVLKRAIFKRLSDRLVKDM